METNSRQPYSLIRFEMGNSIPNYRLNWGTRRFRIRFSGKPENTYFKRCSSSFTGASNQSRRALVIHHRSMNDIVYVRQQRGRPDVHSSNGKQQSNIEELHLHCSCLLCTGRICVTRDEQTIPLDTRTEGGVLLATSAPDTFNRTCDPRDRRLKSALATYHYENRNFERAIPRRRPFKAAIIVLGSDVDVEEDQTFNDENDSAVVKNTGT
ncbi:hypothetical protein EVAR_2695_1 [Eumeta japonica]|uniref:Uncharacterized protein n=1 Tax=Eumeta variegata TaxID=151549 RepID=A0A4C1SQ19_EUMVA|nr:hypothetical protein EVAR_2695_1 [Eumeta japonica]